MTKFHFDCATNDRRMSPRIRRVIETSCCEFTSGFGCDFTATTHRYHSDDAPVSQRRRVGIAASSRRNDWEFASACRRVRDCNALGSLWTRLAIAISSGALEIPKGSLLKQYRPWGVTNVVSNLEFLLQWHLPKSAICIEFAEDCGSRHLS